MTIAEKMRNVRTSWRAVRSLWREELSFRIQTVLGFSALVLAYLLGVSSSEAVIMILAVGTVFSVEALNTSIEELCDHVTPEQNPRIGKIKDLGSAAAFLVGVAATIVCTAILAPKLIALT